MYFFIQQFKVLDLHITNNNTSFNKPKLMVIFL